MVATTGGWNYNDIAYCVNNLRCTLLFVKSHYNSANMFTTVPSLRAVTDAQFGLMNIPFAVAK